MSNSWFFLQKIARLTRGLALCVTVEDPVKECTCSPAIVTRYQKRISGPLLDRIDIHVEVPRVEYEKLASDTPLESSGSIKVRVEAAREVQRMRFEGTRLTCNAEADLAGEGEITTAHLVEAIQYRPRRQM